MQDSIRVWMNGISNRAEGTRQLYLTHFDRFLCHVKMTPDELRRLKWDENKSEKPWEHNKVENLVRQYLRYMEEKEGLSCAYARVTYTAIRSFFRKNNLPLNMDGNDRPDGEGFGSAVPTRDQMKRIVHGAGSLRYRALILFLKDSGLRISDALRLKWGDLKDYSDGFYGFEIVTKKKRAKAAGFMGPETSEALHLYKQRRLKGTRKIPPEKNIEDHYLFCVRVDPTKPMSVPSVSLGIGRILRNLEYNDLSAHGFRKFWEQNMKADREAYLKQIIGRKLTSTERAYLKKNPGDLFKIYKANYDNLRILEQPQLKTDEIEAIVQKRVQELQTKLTERNQVIHDMKGRLEFLYGEMLEIQKFMRDLRAQIKKEKDTTSSGKNS